MASRPIDAQKQLGAFYTPVDAVRFLVQWGLEVAPGRVMDPSCGDGRFLVVAAEMGATHLIGIDLDENAIAETTAALKSVQPPAQLITSDFFKVSPATVMPVDLVVGNPPFIRYQHFKGETRRCALESALCVGVRLTQLTASWAPFLLHALQFLQQGGALAMVVPAEIVNTTYGNNTLRALAGAFRRIRLVSFEQNWFDDAQEETLLLLAEGRGESCNFIELIPLQHVLDLHHLDLTAVTPNTQHLDLTTEGPIAFVSAFLTDKEWFAWQLVQNHPLMKRIGELGAVTNGYVTGANSFFHRTLASALSEGLPTSWLIPTARNARSLRGLRYTLEDIAESENHGLAHHLVVPEDCTLFNTNLDALARFIERGKSQEIPKRFKCRTRKTWWKVPGLVHADVFLPYMIGTSPHSSVNAARALYSNTLHGIRLLPEISPDLFAFSLHSTVTLLSMELEGRSYGGGILKLEPSELERVLLVQCPQWEKEKLEAAFNTVDQLLRAGDYTAAVSTVDEFLLRRCMGLPQTTIDLLAAARRRLVERRVKRNRIKKK